MSCLFSGCGQATNNRGTEELSREGIGTENEGNTDPIAQEPTLQTTLGTTPRPTTEPTSHPTAEPTPEPTAEPTPQPTVELTPQQTVEPMRQSSPEPTEEPETEVNYVVHTNTKKFHKPTCSSVKDIKESNRWDLPAIVRN